MEDKVPLIATLLLSCPDQKGLVARISQFVFQRGGNILNLDEHVEREEKMFFTRVEWDTEEVSLSSDEFEKEFSELANEISANYEIRYSSNKHKLAIFVSKYEHCIKEILWLNSIGELEADIKLIVSNHNDLEYLGQRYNIPFHLFPVTKENKSGMEMAEINLLKENRIDTIILAVICRCFRQILLKNSPSE